MIELSDYRGDWNSIKAILPALIEKYETEIQLAPGRLAIAGKTGPEAQKEQCAWPVYYGMLKAEVTKLLRYIDMRIDSIRGDLTRRYNEGYSRELSEKARERYIDNEHDYMRFRELYLEVEELKDKLATICDGFDRRGFALRDWTALKVSEHTDLTI